MKYQYEVELEADKGTEVYTVAVDGRDVCEWEAKHGKTFGGDISYTDTVELAYFASRRSKASSLEWSQFRSSCVWVKEVRTEDQESARPTRKARGGGQPSR